MKIFTVYVKSGEDLVESAKYVQEGFSYKAFFLNIFWLGYHNLWIPTIATLLVFILVGQVEAVGLVTPVQKFFIILAIMFYIGFTGRDFIRLNLEKNGYYLEDLIVASDIDDAEHKFVSSIFSDIKHDIETINHEQKTHPETSKTNFIS